MSCAMFDGFFAGQIFEYYWLLCLMPVLHSERSSGVAAPCDCKRLLNVEVWPKVEEEQTDCSEMMTTL